LLKKETKKVKDKNKATASILFHLLRFHKETADHLHGQLEAGCRSIRLGREVWGLVIGH